MEYLPNDDNINFDFEENVFLDNNLIILNIDGELGVTTIDELNRSKYFLNINN